MNISGDCSSNISTIFFHNVFDLYYYEEDQHQYFQPAVAVFSNGCALDSCLHLV